MFNDVFGELYYEYDWIGKTSLDWYGESIDVDLIVLGEENEEIDALQCESYTSFMNEWNTIKESLLESVLLYYQNLRSELGYDIEDNEYYPEITTIEEIKKRITLDALVIPLSGIYEGRSAALAFTCDWDPENGLGIVFVDEKITQIGYQDIVF